MTFKETVSFLVQSLVRASGSAVNKGKRLQREASNASEQNYRDQRLT